MLIFITGAHIWFWFARWLGGPLPVFEWSRIAPWPSACACQHHPCRFPSLRNLRNRPLVPPRNDEQSTRDSAPTMQKNTLLHAVPNGHAWWVSPSTLYITVAMCYGRLWTEPSWLCVRRSRFPPMPPSCIPPQMPYTQITVSTWALSAPELCTRSAGRPPLASPPLPSLGTCSALQIVPPCPTHCSKLTSLLGANDWCSAFICILEGILNGTRRL